MWNIFFDLDHTLWDFDKSSKQTLLSLYQKYELSDKIINHEIISFDDFLKAFQTTTKFLWKQHHEGLVDKVKIRERRFSLIFEELYKMTNKKLKKEYIFDKVLYQKPHYNLLEELENEYQYNCPRQPNLMPFVLEMLTYLQSKGYHLHILTNGFEESQKLKLEYSGILSFFKNIITSDCTGVTKPNPIIFNHALAISNATPQNSIMIGDSFDADILGARSLGMKTIFYNPHKKTPQHSVASYDISCWKEIENIL
ncbi:haloacid dehalogenase superfamily enzyme, subfamily IA [Bernardetia litoralis DSM 6794]|uniref:Haloacid dehalogenase superfamily enzyme, subfamily IA n=2 Tax=Bernardetia litoralis TaxID=999 RepID=I4AHZ6_BERLS|nr:haloacid dehalogenase superfamily enzyme, subfamily IA [Bernardetia litoralis DSM 6794]